MPSFPALLLGTHGLAWCLLGGASKLAPGGLRLPKLMPHRLPGRHHLPVSLLPLPLFQAHSFSRAEHFISTPEPEPWLMFKDILLNTEQIPKQKHICQLPWIYFWDCGVQRPHLCILDIYSAQQKASRAEEERPPPKPMSVDTVC